MKYSPASNAGVRCIEHTSSSTVANVATANAVRIGRVGPNLSYSMPPIGAQNAPISAPGSTSAPATNASVPNDSCARLVIT